MRRFLLYIFFIVPMCTSAQFQMLYFRVLDYDTAFVNYGDTIRLNMDATYINQNGNSVFLNYMSFGYSVDNVVQADSLTSPLNQFVLNNNVSQPFELKIPVTPSNFLTGGGGHTIIVWPIVSSYPTPVAPDTIIIHQTYTVGPLGIADLDQPEMILFPNPFTNYLRLLCKPEEGKYFLKIFSADGRLVHSDARTQPLEWVIGTDSWNKGIYIVMLHTEQGKTYYYKIIHN